MLERFEVAIIQFTNPGNRECRSEKSSLKTGRRICTVETAGTESPQPGQLVAVLRKNAVRAIRRC